MNIIVYINDDFFVDIWKTGISYWGYTWEPTLSLKGEVVIEHANIGVDGNVIFK